MIFIDDLHLFQLSEALGVLEQASLVVGLLPTEKIQPDSSSQTENHMSFSATDFPEYILLLNLKKLIALLNVRQFYPHKFSYY